MKNGNTGIFPAINLTMCETLREITDRGNDAEVRKRHDGTYDVFELEKKKPRARAKENTEPVIR